MCWCDVTAGRLVVTFSTFLLLCGSTYPCFVRNCPPGGKRSMDVVSRATVPCLSCGPGNVGQCVGPNICCGVFGCYMGTPESRVCQKENESTRPCAISGERCGSHGQGSCVADGMCCDSSACLFSAKCQSSAERTDSVQLLSLLNKILQSEELE